MNATLESVLRCEHCNKPFDKESTLKRHGYYCRSRKSTPKSRLRACVSCTKRKAGCDGVRPQCSRCRSRGLDCRYTMKDGTASRAEVLSNSQNGQPLDATLDDVSSTTLMETTGVDLTGLDWDTIDSDLVELLGTPVDDSLAQLTRATQNTDLPLIAPQPTLAPRSFIQRFRANAGTQRTATLIMHTLRSYIRMLSHNDRPPFVHSSLLSSKASDMESLNNCISLLHLLRSNVRGSRKLFWENVRRECEIIGVEHSKVNKWKLLAAVQALSVYIFVRLEEKETEHNDVDYLLVVTVTMLSKQLKLIEPRNLSYNNDVLMDWEEWVWWESIRRLCTLYQVFNMLAYFEPAELCELPESLVLAPLPAKRQLWEAGNEVDWEMSKGKEIPITLGLTTQGDLVNLGEGEICWGEKPWKANANWEEWCSGMDTFGGLIMLAAALIA